MASFKALDTTERAPWPAEQIGDAAFADYLRGAAKTVYHPPGICRTGQGDMAFVDKNLRVNGLPHPRVSRNSNTPSAIIGKRCADVLLAR